MRGRYKTRRDLIGMMRHEIKFVRLNHNNNSAIPSEEDAETVVLTAMASAIRTSQGDANEVETAQRRTGLHELIFTIRYAPIADDTTLQIEHLGDRYDITSVYDMDGDMAFMEIHAIRRK